MQSSEQDGPVNGPLPNKPDSKLPAIPKGTRVSKRPLGHRLPVRPRSSTRSRPTDDNTSRDARIIYVSTGTPFMSVVSRALKTLEKAPSRRKGMPLKARIEAIGKGDGGSAKGGKELKDDVLIIGTGRAIEKTLSVAAWLTRRQDLKVSLRTRSVGTVDDIVPDSRKVAEGDEVEEYGVGEESSCPTVEESARVRWLSCLEVGVCMR